jgi:hypothetical protein
VLPFVFHPTRWMNTASLVDELRIDWRDLPLGTKARLYLPSIAPETIVSLRNLRHAPPTVRAIGDGMLELDVVRGVTYLPIPPAAGSRVAGVMTLELPAGVRAGQRFIVDVTQLRAASSMRIGGFRIEVLVKKERDFFAQVARGVELLHDQIGQLASGDRWRPILEHRLETERQRAHSLAVAAGVPWKDPTRWHDADGVLHPMRGTKVRMVLERIDVVDASEPFWKGAGEIDLRVTVRTDDNGGIERTTRVPRHGELRVRDGESVTIDEVVFKGFVEDHLAISIDAMERDWLDPDDRLGRYVRVFRCPPERWLGRYAPGRETSDPEDVGAWRVHYRLERA